MKKYAEAAPIAINFTVDVDQGITVKPKSLTIQQGEHNARYFQVSLVHNEMPVNLANSEVHFLTQPHKSDEIPTTTNCEIYDAENGQVMVAVKDYMSNKSGIINGEFVRIGEDGSSLPFKNFTISVDGSIFVNDGLGQSEPLHSLVSALARVQRVEEYLEQEFMDVEAKYAGELSKTNAQLSEIANAGTTVEVVQKKVEEMAQQGLIQAYSIGNQTIEERKTVFFDATETKNLYKDSEMTVGRFITNTGVISDNSGYCFTGFIQVNEGDTVVCSYENNGTRHFSLMRWVACYDNEKNILADKGHAGDTTSFVIPSDVKYIRITLYALRMDKLQIEKSVDSNFTSYEAPFEPVYNLKEKYIKDYVKKDEVSMLDSLESELVKCTNLCDETKIQPGAVYVSGNSAVFNAEMSGYIRTDYIPVNVGDKVVASWGIYSRQIFPSRFIVGFDKEKNLVVDSYLNNTTSEKVYTVPNNVKFLIFSFGDGYLGNNIQIEVNERGMSTGYVKYFEPYQAIKDNKIINTEIDLYLPPKIYVAVGRTIELYDSQVCLQSAKYHIKWDCTIGKAMKRKFSVTGSSTNRGVFPLAVSVIDDHFNVLASASTEIVIADNINTNISICPIGDSLTNAKPWECEIMTLSNDKISFVGTRYTKIPSDSNGVNKPYYHEGRSGFSAGDYLKATEYIYENEGIHPFWDGNRFNWNYYKVQNNKSPNAIILFLGTNNMNLEPTENANDIKKIVDYIRQDEINIPIYLCHTLFRGNQDGLGMQVNTDGYSAVNSGKYKYEEDKKVFNLMRKLYSLLKDYTNLYFVPIATCHDSEYNFGAIEMPVNPRAIQSELLPVEATHPQNQGYYQFADIIYSAIACTYGK